MSYSSSSSAEDKLPGPEALAGCSTAALAQAGKRLYDTFFSALGLVVLSPLFVVLAALIKAADGGPAFYRQCRIGQHGRPFFICKFRTMVPRADTAGPLVTGDGDARVTWIGRILRKTKLDELPQLWNVLKGEMSLVGPRPEVPRYVERYTPDQREILNLKPGITDLASLRFRNEELLLRNADNLEEFYVRNCIPRKIELNLEYAVRSNPLSDTWIILQTICPYWISLLSLYTLVLAGSFWAASLLVYDFAPPSRLREAFGGTLLEVVAVQLGALIWRKQCKGLLSYFSLPELKQIATALGLACLVLLGLWAADTRHWPPRNLILVDTLLALCALSGFRIMLRLWRERAAADEDDAAADDPPLRVGIIGAGRVGSQLARDLRGGTRFGRTVVAFFDDDCQKWHRRVHEIPVIGMPECLLEGWAAKLDEVIVAIPEASSHRLSEIRDLLQKAGLSAYPAASAHGLWLGKGSQEAWL